MPLACSLCPPHLVLWMPSNASMTSREGTFSPGTAPSGAPYLGYGRRRRDVRRRGAALQQRPAPATGRCSSLKGRTDGEHAQHQVHGARCRHRGCRSGAASATNAQSQTNGAFLHGTRDLGAAEAGS